jgi:hypothetical protein
VQQPKDINENHAKSIAVNKCVTDVIYKKLLVSGTVYLINAPKKNKTKHGSTAEKRDLLSITSCTGVLISP